nr:unnamed protein product [Callosobruchus analis]
MEDKADLLEQIEQKQTKENNKPNKPHNTQRYTENKTATLTTAFQHKCTICNGAHRIHNCHKFLELTVSSRNLKITELKHCVNCLKPNHTATECKAGTCRHCNAKHHSLLHVEATTEVTPRLTQNNANNRQIDNTDATPSQNQNNSNQQHRTTVSMSNQYSHTENTGEVLLSTASVLVKDADGNCQVYRALLDSASMSSFITSTCCNRLGLKRTKINMSAICNLSTKGIQEQLAKFWLIEEPPSCLKTESDDDTECEDIFVKNVYRDSDNRFVVSIPFKEPLTKLGDSKLAALKRLYSMENKLAKNTKLKQTYYQFMADYEKAGYMTKLQKPDNSHVCYYLPHHGVFKETSSSTRLRVVFDGSSPSDTNISLNELQYVGSQNLQDDLYSILLRFRTHYIIISGDISKMFLQIKIKPEQRDLLRVLWRTDPLQEVSTYTLNTVPFGLKSSPFLAMRCLKQLSIEHAETHKEASQVISHDFYMDDMLSGAHSEAEAIQICKDVFSILKSAGFELSKWNSNSKEVFNYMQTLNKSQSPSVPISKQFGEQNQIKTLGQVICKNHVNIELHGFADASCTAFGAVIYLRSVDSSGDIYVNLLCSKSKVAPLKSLTIPKLELSGALFIYNAKKHNVDKLRGPLAASELFQSTELLLRLAQRDSFYDDINILKKSQNLPKESKLLRLDPFLDSKNILRVGGRLHLSDLTFRQKHPVLLSPKHHFTQLLVRYEHLRLYHASPRLLNSSLRENYWIVAGNNIVKRIVHQCITCFRAKPKGINQIMGILPEDRVKPQPPFYITGCDFAGPILIKQRQGRGASHIKAYIAVFVCFVTRAVHLELLTSLSTAAFISMFRRFVSRRSKPQKIYSDNGKTFIGARSELTELGRFLKQDHKTIFTEIVNDGVEWKFIPPYAPHHGGIWEAAVKSAKLHMKRSIGNSKFTYEEMATLLAQIEAILNSRPLTPLSSEPTDTDALTPAHFLIGRRLTMLPDPNLQDTPDTRLSRFQRIQQISQNFWKRWASEYMNELQQRVKWKTTQQQLQIGTLVLIREDSAPPLLWKLGRVEKLHSGPDGMARVATIRTATSTFKRALSKLSPLQSTKILIT